MCALLRHRWRNVEGFYTVAYHSEASLPRAHECSPGVCARRAPHIPFPRAPGTDRAVLYQRLMEVFKINPQSPSGNLFFSRWENPKWFKGAPCSRLTAKGEGPSPSSGRGGRHDMTGKGESGHFGASAYVCFWGFPSRLGWMRQYFSSNLWHTIKYCLAL